MRLAIIGAGNVGRALGRRWVDSGHDVTFGMREPDSADAKSMLNDFKGPGTASAASNRNAASRAEVVYLTTPWNATEEAIRQCGDLAGKIVVDCTNPVKLGATEEMLEVGRKDSAGERVAAWADGAVVFKSLNQVGWEIMADPRLEGRRAVMFLAGPDGPERVTVAQLIEELGFEVIYLGDIALSRLLEPLGMVWIHAAIAMGMGRDWALSIVRRN